MMFQTESMFQKVNLDVVENIVCLCPNCHQKLHHGIYKEYESELIDLFNKKEKDLLSAGIVISKKDFLNLYKKNLPKK